jgi:DNA polymerase III epsilon subunit-like protein
MNMDIGAASGEADALARLRVSPDWRILSRVQPLASWPRATEDKVTRIAVLDTETTGLDHD